jgi:hypothetical protein
MKRPYHYQVTFAHSSQENPETWLLHRVTPSRRAFHLRWILVAQYDDEATAYAVQRDLNAHRRAA